MPFDAARLKDLPRSPGVYLMKDAAGEVIYIGKAKQLSIRVRNYFTGSDERHSIAFILERLETIETIVTADERQAIILESDLIRKYKPRYNIRLKDDRAHFLVRIDQNQEWPKIELVRRREEDGAKYLGPFPFSYELRSMLETIKRSVPLRTCSDKVLHNRVRPCLEYQIKRCAGPCCLAVDRAQYQRWVKQAIQILEGKDKELVEHLRSEMERASEEWRFEDAAVIRDRINVLESVGDQRSTVLFSSGAQDAIAVYRVGERIEIALIMARGGRLSESRSFAFEDAVMPEGEILASFLAQCYVARGEIPQQILLPFSFEGQEALEELLSERAGHPVSISVPQRGSRVRLLQLAQVNARENYNARYSSSKSSDELLKILQSELGLDEMPRTIECVDVSHFQGGSTVGSLVVFQDGAPDRTRYRNFKLSQEGKADDFASMRELIFRHLSRAAEENTLSDLMVIDGGPQQLAQGLRQREALALDRPIMIGLAKKRRRSLNYNSTREQQRKPERVFIEGSHIPVVLPPNSKALQLLERIRDETHRTAITFHRKLRNKRAFTSELDRIPGIGEKRKLRLLKVFSSVKNIRQASAEEIAEKGEMPLSLARRLLELL